MTRAGDVLIRRIDDMGRLVIPGIFRRELGWSPDTTVEVARDGQTLTVRGHQPVCWACGDPAIMLHREHPVCQRCQAALRRAHVPDV